VRSEMRYVVRTDHDGDHVQYQGDRIQGLFYEAAATSRFVSKAFEAAAAMHSVMKLCRILFPALKDVGMTVGIDFGRVLVTQLGIRGNRDIIALATSVQAASALQASSAPGQTKVSKKVFDKLEEELASFFEEDGSVYVSTADAEVVAAKQDAKAYTGKVAVIGSASTGARVVPSTSGLRPARSWLRRK